MAAIDPQQELFCKLKLNIEELGYAVYDGCLPPEGTPYPFVYLGDFFQVDDAGNKTAIFGKVSATMHVWSNTPKNRGTVSAMLLAIKQVCYNLERTNNFCWATPSVSQRIIPDASTKSPLLHGVIDAEFKFN
ncbi:MAG: hypothetical protein RR385_09420 [Clostridiales bacterium]